MQRRFLRHLDDPYYCGFKAKTIFTKSVSKDNNSISNSSSGKSNGTISESKKSSVSSFFSSKNKDGSKSKEKEKDKEKEKVEKEKEKDVVKDKEASSPKQRPSVAQLPHPASFSTLYQLHQMQNGMLNGTMKHNGIFQRHNSQPEPYMWHAKSYDNGLGKALKLRICFVNYL